MHATQMFRPFSDLAHTHVRGVLACCVLGVEGRAVSGWGRSGQQLHEGRRLSSRVEPSAASGRFGWRSALFALTAASTAGMGILLMQPPPPKSQPSSTQSPLQQPNTSLQQESMQDPAKDLAETAETVLHGRPAEHQAGMAGPWETDPELRIHLHRRWPVLASGRSNM